MQAVVEISVKKILFDFEIKIVTVMDQSSQ